jgi:hypothetical protein
MGRGRRGVRGERAMRRAGVAGSYGAGNATIQSTGARTAPDPPMTSASATRTTAPVRGHILPQTYDTSVAGTSILTPPDC